MQYGIHDIRIAYTPTPLDKVYELHCSCGWYVDCGYMWATAEHLYKTHHERYPGHELDMVVENAPPLAVKQVNKKWRQGKDPRRCVTIRVEPGLT